MNFTPIIKHLTYSTSFKCHLIIIWARLQRNHKQQSDPLDLFHSIYVNSPEDTLAENLPIFSISSILPAPGHSRTIPDIDLDPSWVNQRWLWGNLWGTGFNRKAFMIIYKSFIFYSWTLQCKTVFSILNKWSVWLYSEEECCKKHRTIITAAMLQYVYTIQVRSEVQVIC